MFRRRTFHFWTFAPIWIADAVEQIADEFGIDPSDIHHDCENVYEWFEGTASSGVFSFNFSHRGSYCDESPNPILMMFWDVKVRSPKSSIGKRLAKTLEHKVFFGDAHYETSHEFVCRPKREFEP